MKLTRCGNGELAKFIHQCKRYAPGCMVKWIPFNEFKNIEYLAKGGFGEVHKATWINYYDIFEGRYKDEEVVLKRIYNSSDKIVDILKEVKIHY